jgi:hypothetical protein
MKHPWSLQQLLGDLQHLMKAFTAFDGTHIMTVTKDLGVFPRIPKNGWIFRVLTTSLGYELRSWLM